MTVPRLLPRLLVCAALAVCAAPGCGPPPKDPAVVAYQTLYRALRDGQEDAAWEALTPTSRRALTARLGLAPEAPPEAVLKRLGVRPGWQFEVDDPRIAKVLPEDSGPNRRLVQGPLGGLMWRFPVVQVDGQWRVDLFGARPE